MKQTVTRSMFIAAFRDTRPDNFSHAGLHALFDWFEDYNAELDVIAICCDFSEYADLAEFQEDYNSEEFRTVEDVHDHTTVILIPHSPGFIIAAF